MQIFQRCHYTVKKEKEKLSKLKKAGCLKFLSLLNFLFIYFYNAVKKSKVERT